MMTPELFTTFSIPHKVYDAIFALAGSYLVYYHTYKILSNTAINVRYEKTIRWSCMLFAVGCYTTLMNFGGR